MNKINPNQRIGEIGHNALGLKMTIIEYINSYNTKIKFDNGYITNCSYGNFKRGAVKNLYYKDIYNMGYVGKGNYPVKINGKVTKSYDCWKSMIRRCYSKKFKTRQPTYEGCNVCEDWLCYQNFAKWFDENYYEFDSEIMQLDKDILIKGNRTYSPETCIFVPQSINKLFTKRQNDRGKYLIGVSLRKSKNNAKPSYVAYCSDGNKKRYIGDFKTELEAFNVYKVYKENVIKERANKHKNVIPEKLYNAMYNYQVDISD